MNIYIDIFWKYMTYNPPTPDTRRPIHPPNDESKMERTKVFLFNFHFAILSETLWCLILGRRAETAGVRQLPATPTALSFDCKWQEGGAGATGGRGRGRGYMVQKP